MTNGRKPDAVAGGGVPEILVGATVQSERAFGGFQNHRKGCHSPPLRVVESAVLAVGRLARFAATEVARGNRLAIALMCQELDEPRFVLDFLVENSRGQIVSPRVLSEGHVAHRAPASNGAALRFEQQG